MRRLYPATRQIHSSKISTNAFRRNATMDGGNLNLHSIISIHAFRRMRRLRHPMNLPQIFQSTHSAGNATMTICVVKLSLRFFNPRIPQECDAAETIPTYPYMIFQSTHSAGNATFVMDFQSTRGPTLNHANRLISIAFRRECDPYVGPKVVHQILYFNPRIPQGMRLYLTCNTSIYLIFNPRIPQGMRLRHNSPIKYYKISIHAFRRECDGQVLGNRKLFNPRIPQGNATV